MTVLAYTLDSGSAAGQIGEWVCVTGANVTRATFAAVTAAGGVKGMLVSAGNPGTSVNVCVDGVLPPAFTGLAALAGKARLNTTTCRAERVVSFSGSDIPLGDIDATGHLDFSHEDPTPNLRTDVTALPTPRHNSVAVCAEVSAPYRFDASDLGAGDGWTRLKANDSTPGTWLLQGDTISLAAGTSAATIAAAVAAVAGKARVLIRPGATTINANIVLPNNTHVALSEATVLTSTQTAVGGFPGHYTFDALLTQVNPGGTLASTPAFGATTLSVSSSVKPTIGNTLSIQKASSSVSWASYDIINSTGASSPWTVTIDRPVVWPWASGDITQEWTGTLHDIRLDGYGAQLNGTGDQMLEFAQVRRPYIDGIQFLPVSGLPAGAFFGYDVGCRDGLIQNVFADLTGSAGNQNGFYLQSNERTEIRSCTVKNAIIVGIGLYDCFACGIDDCHAVGCPRGVQVGAFNASSVGSFDCWVKGGSAVGAGTGLYIDGTTRTNVVGFASLSCTTYGIYVGAKATSTRLSRCQVTNSATGVLIQPGAKDTRIDGLEASGCNSGAISASADVDIDNLYAKGITLAANGVVLFAGGVGRIRNSETQNLSSTGYGVIMNGASRVVVDHHKHTGVAGSGTYGYYAASGGTMILNECTATGSDFGVVVNGGSTVYVSVGCDFSGCGSPFFIFSGTLIVEQRGSVSKAVTTADVTLSFSEAQSRKIVTTGVLTGNRNVILPTIDGMEWSVFCNNTGAFTTTFKTAAGTGQVVAQGKRAVLQCDGTNIVRVTPDT